MPRPATVFHHANVLVLGGGMGAGPHRGLREEAGDTLMDLSPASHNHSPGHSRTQREEGGETEERRQRQRDREKRKTEWGNRDMVKGGITD